jgi:hypothetical protein
MKMNMFSWTLNFKSFQTDQYKHNSFLYPRIQKPQIQTHAPPL